MCALAGLMDRDQWRPGPARAFGCGCDGRCLQAHGHDDAYVREIAQREIHVRRIKAARGTAEHGRVPDPRRRELPKAPIAVRVVRDDPDGLNS